MKHISIILGVLLPTFVLADELYTSDIIGGCGDVYNYTAIFEPIVYTCVSGYYLPAGAISCQACPETHNCPGGTFTFDANHTQGIEYGDILVSDAMGSCSSEFTQNFAAVFEPITYDCDAGYYLPADAIECELCLENSYCSGGTYTYNETITQGIMKCPDTLVSPMGMYDIGSCGRKMHIGDEIVFMRSQKKTTPSLNIDINNDGVADYFGSLSQTRTVMTRNSQHYLHIGDYYLYDDSVK